VDIIEELTSYGANIEVYDPWADPDEARAYYGVTMIDTLPVNHYDGVVLAVAHDQFTKLTGDDFKKMCRQLAVIYDVKHTLPDDIVDGVL
jgi:UDP-N-acetyl-D-galactosamine dehydrogenase